jgi:hypothetical protein
LLVFGHQPTFPQQGTMKIVRIEMETPQIVFVHEQVVGVIGVLISLASFPHRQRVSKERIVCCVKDEYGKSCANMEAVIDIGGVQTMPSVARQGSSLRT